MIDSICCIPIHTYLYRMLIVRPIFVHIKISAKYLPVVRMAERSKAPDSRVTFSAKLWRSECSGPRMWAWVRIPLLTKLFYCLPWLCYHFVQKFDFAICLNLILSESFTPLCEHNSPLIKKLSPRRGIEPRSPAWQAGILTTILSRTNESLRAKTQTDSRQNLWVSYRILHNRFLFQTLILFLNFGGFEGVI